MTDRTYRKVSPEFWTGETGSKIQEAGKDAVIVAMYLMTCHHSIDTGLFRIPIAYAVEDTGLTATEIEGAILDLQSISFLTYDKEQSVVFVHEMGRYQIGEELKSTDKRVKGVEKRIDPYKKSILYSAFLKKYASNWCLQVTEDLEKHDTKRVNDAPSKPLRRPFKGVKGEGEAPSKPKTKTKAKQEQLARAPVSLPNEEDVPPAPEKKRSEKGAAARLLAAAMDMAGKKTRPKEGRVFVGGKDAAFLFGGDSLDPIIPWQMPRDVCEEIHATLYAPVPCYKKPRPPSTIESDEDDAIAAQMLLAYKAAFSKNNKGKTFRGNCGKRAASMAMCGRVLREQNVSPWLHFDVAFRVYKNPRLFTVASEKAAIRICEIIKKEKVTLGGESQEGETAQMLSRIRSSARMAIHAERPSTPEEARLILDKRLGFDTIEEIYEMILLENDKMAELDRKSLTEGKWIWK